jgi:Copper amine oxidase N-terminal domain
MYKRQRIKTACIAAVALASAGLPGTGPPGVARASSAVRVRLDGKPLATTVSPMEINGRTVVPMRDIFEALGATVQWDGGQQSINAQKDLITVNLQINNKWALLNGNRVMLDQAPLLYRGSTMVPLRFVSEALGAEVNWNSALRTVSINNPAPSYARLNTGEPYPPADFPVPARDETSRPLDQPRTERPRPVLTHARTLSVPSGVVVPVTLDRELSSASAHVGETFTATVVSQRLGDSEFPVGSKIEGVVVEARPKTKDNPGVLDLDFRAVILPNKSRYGLRGQLISLDNTSVTTTQGRIMARQGTASSTGDKLKIVGVGAAAGFVLGKVLDANTTISTVLGAAGGYLYSRNRDKHRITEAYLPAGTRIGVRLTNSATYADTTGYGTYRAEYLRMASRENRADAPVESQVTEEPNRPAYYPPATETRTNAPGYYPPDDQAPAYYPPATQTQVETNDADYYPPATQPPADTANRPAYSAPTYPAPAYPTGQPGYSTAGVRTISIPEGAVVPVTLDREMSSATAHVGETFTATVVSQRLGDSEFPVGSKIEGVVVEARPKTKDNPGVLDLDFRAVILPDRNATRLPLRGLLISLDDNASVTTTQGRIMAKGTSGQSSGDRAKIIGVGAAAGFVLGKVLDQNSTIAAVLGAAGGYLYSRSRDNNRLTEAVVPAGTRIGVRLTDPVSYADTTGYADYRLAYLRM